MSGDQVLRGNAAGDEVFGDPALIEAVSNHVTRWIGPITVVFHEHVSRLVHVDVYYVASTGNRPVEILVTSGMSELPMTTPKDHDVPRFAELIAILPAGWPLLGEAAKDERNYWPVRLIKQLARYPHEHKTWLGSGHSLNEGKDPAEPFAPNTRLSAVIILESNSVPKQFQILHGPGGRKIHFLVVCPLYWEELQLKLRDGTHALIDAFAAHSVTDLIDPHRANVALCEHGRTGTRAARHFH